MTELKRAKLKAMVTDNTHVGLTPLLGRLRLGAS